VPAAMEVLLERHLPSTVMPVLWFIARNTLGRPTDEHSSLGYVELSVKKAARLYGPARVSAPTTRGRRIRTVREAIDWAVSWGLIDRKRHGDTTELSFGPEVWFALRFGEFSLRTGDLLRAERVPIRAPLLSRQDVQLDLFERSMDDDAFPFGDVLRAAQFLKRRSKEAAARARK
jgi:hypothetical protein